MALVIIGIFKDFVESIIPSPTQAIIGPGNCDHLIVNGNATKGYEECVHGLEFASHYNNSVQDSFQLPVTPTVVYIGGLSAAFFLAGVFHFSEIGCLVYSIIYLLALPSGKESHCVSPSLKSVLGSPQYVLGALRYVVGSPKCVLASICVLDAPQCVLGAPQCVLDAQCTSMCALVRRHT